ncbi:MAG: Fis family transcriptional regulator [gamma proteobacterium symbiont of Ctena orbiculata]|uniref:Sigma-54 dependent transcriptional regulator n=1 Tax=Candidatus Thiodiazotropha taylori TaxID=2792791 RepID=A0A944MB15_9GAMM|nr:sigma-54 dependent transcriptional regulator [Candidatus Thiodiazotropha taylori]PUB81289.1 MAG: sigma-54-dependent Fis family transcriptional regulator [gamma proteobacterium symbiont of Ctena orbiculata]MBT3029462.1 sigma-54 dependent transcriptional regulator [Candidatus Thiodiazotropha taylori]MBT3037291.1 sigma-54 dependent transcriptional regulator [Candidatus Thiodiazotropha taylori]MBV2139268.1 sigma-54 dependent transcriptional regulator [Candidatus Thiodiazotropha taylori]
MKLKIVVVEDDELLRQLLIQHLVKLGYEADGLSRWDSVLSYLDKYEPALIITDARLPDANSLEHIESIATNYPVIVLTAFGSVRDAVNAIKAGAVDYILKPVSLDTLSLTVERALDNAALRKDHFFCKRQLEQSNQHSSLVGNSEALAKVKQLIDAVAPNDITVLIQGESGSGKELVARAIHAQSHRKSYNFVAIDCCTLQENLFESELFGHEKGAFTGADKQKKGLIEGAEGGTLFLDEIGEINSNGQAKLLRVLETGQYRRLGSTKDLNANVRIVAATNRDLESMSSEGGFRSDLFFRLNAFNIEMPPLRNRRDDIPELAKHFLTNHNFSTRVNKNLSSSAIRSLISYDWPGNIRELKNVIERAIILSGERQSIKPEHFAFTRALGKSDGVVSLSFDHDPSLEELEASYLSYQLKKYSGRRAKVAQVMGISERSIYRMIKRYSLDDIKYKTN